MSGSSTSNKYIYTYLPAAYKKREREIVTTKSAARLDA